MGTIKVDVAGAVARVTLDRPDRRNALTIPMLQALSSAMGDLGREPDVRAIVLSGAGSDFCAGADLSELEDVRSRGRLLEFDRPLRHALGSIATHPVPVIARVHGGALGGGFQLVLACDLAVAHDEAQIGIPSARLGIVIPLESIERLVLAVGPARAAELLLAGRVLSGVEAQSWGLVSTTASWSDLDAATERAVESIVQGAPLSIRATKRGVGMVLENLSLERPDGLSSAGFDVLAAQAFASDDLAEGISAFREKRQPDFRGR